MVAIRVPTMLARALSPKPLRKPPSSEKLSGGAAWRREKAKHATQNRRRMKMKEEVEIREGSVVYFISAPSAKRIKIGVAGRSVKSRLDNIQGYSPVPLRLVGFLPGWICRERALHRKFRCIRSHREWFRADPVLLDFIADVALKPADYEAWKLLAADLPRAA